MHFIVLICVVLFSFRFSLSTMLAVIPSRHKTGSLDQYRAKNVSTDSMAPHLSVTQVDTIDNPISKQCHQHQDITEDKIFSEMKLESNRLYSFKNRWPLIDIKPESLAAAGFFYLQEEDRVQCPFCYVIIYNWTAGDKPLREHMRKSPKCPFLVGSDVGNIPLVSGKQNLISLTLGHNSKPFSSVSASYRPKHSRMADVKRRILTFSGWPLSIPRPEELAECGLYYSGVADVVTCFFCGGTLGNWDPEDDPWVEHSKFFPDCSFLAVTKSKHSATAMKSVAASGKEIYKNREKEVKGMSSQNTSSDIVQQALDIFPDHLVFDALKKKIHISSLQELCDEILDMKQQSHDEICVIPEEINSTSVSSSCSASSDAILCKLCMDRERGVVFQPCGHLISCWQCSNMISDCPVCRRPIIHKIKTYFS